MSMSTREDPQGRLSYFSKFVDGVLTFFRRSDGVAFWKIDGANKKLIVPAGATLELGGASIASAIRTVRRRFTVAEINAGATLLAAIDGYKYRPVDYQAIAIGGAASGSTAVELSGTRSAGAVVLWSIPIALLLRSAVVRVISTIIASPDVVTTVLADGASHTALDENTAITIAKTGGTLATATHVDISLDYVLEEA